MAQTTPEPTVEELIAATPGLEEFLAANPGIGLGDLVALWPILQELLAVIAAGPPYQGTIPKVKLRIAGHHLVLGPTPVQVTN